MRGRTMYVVPFSMGPVGGPLSHIGVQVTDSAYAVTSIGIMTRVGTDVLREIAGGAPWVKTVHSVGAPLAAGRAGCRVAVQRREVHRALPRHARGVVVRLGLRRQRDPREEVLRAAHRLGHRPRRGLARRAHAPHPRDRPAGPAYHVAAAFPSACGKTNLAMLRPTIPGWRVETLGDDIAWLRPGDDGRLWAINPEAGFFGVAPGTGESTNVTAVETLWGNTIFTNVALRPDGDVWWEGLTDEAPAELTDWEGNPWTPDIGSPRRAPQLALHGERRAVPADRRRLGCPAGRAARRHPVRRPPRDERPARRRGDRLDARRLHGLEHLVRAHRRRRGHGRRAAPRPVRDAAVLRLQHGRLLRPLAQGRPEAALRPRAARLPGELVPQGLGRPVPLARLRRQRPRHRLDHPPHRRRGRRGREPDRPPAAHRGPRPRRHRRAAGRPRRAVRDRPRVVAARGRPHRGVLRDLRRPRPRAAVGRARRAALPAASAAQPLGSEPRRRRPEDPRLEPRRADARPSATASTYALVASVLDAARGAGGSDQQLVPREVAVQRRRLDELGVRALADDLAVVDARRCGRCRRRSRGGARSR